MTFNSIIIPKCIVTRKDPPHSINITAIALKIIYICSTGLVFNSAINGAI